MFFLACPEAKTPPPVEVNPRPPPPPVQPTPPPEPEQPAEPPPPPPAPPVVLNEPMAVDGGTIAEEAMPPWSKVEVGDFLVYDVETSRSDAVTAFRIAGGQLPTVRARVKLTAAAVDKTGVTVDVRYVPNGADTTVPRWLETGLSLKMLMGAARPRGQAAATEPALLQVPPKTPLSWVEHAGKKFKCRYARTEAATPEGAPSRRCVGSTDRELILGSGTVYAQNIKGSNGNPLTVILVEAGKGAAPASAGPQAFEDGIPLVTRETSPAGERLSFLKLTAAGGQVKTDETVHPRAPTGGAAALTYDGANWTKPDVRKLNQELAEWVTSLFTDEGLFNVLPEAGTPGASLVFGAMRIDTVTVGFEAAANGDQPARTFRWLVPARPGALKVAPVWIRYGSVELSVYEGDHVWKRRVVTFQK